MFPTQLRGTHPTWQAPTWSRKPRHEVRISPTSSSSPPLWTPQTPAVRADLVGEDGFAQCGGLPGAGEAGRGYRQRQREQREQGLGGRYHALLKALGAMEGSGQEGPARRRGLQWWESGPGQGWGQGPAGEQSRAGPWSDPPPLAVCNHTSPRRLQHLLFPSQV